MGSSYPFAKEVLGVMSPLLYGAARDLVAGLFLFAMMAAMRRPLALPRRDWVPMILLVLIGVAAFQACWGWAMTRTAPSVGSIVTTTTTAFSATPRLVRRLPPAGAGLGRHPDRLPRPHGRAGAPGGEPRHGLYLIPVAGVGLSAAFFGDPLTAARVLGGTIVLLGVILTRVALDRAARVPV